MDKKIELAALVCEMEGMTAENKQREHLGQSMAYVEVHFLLLADKMRKLKSSAPELPGGSGR